MPNVGVRQPIGRRASKKPTKTTKKTSSIKMGPMPGAADCYCFYTYVFPSNALVLRRNKSELPLSLIQAQNVLFCIK